MSQNQSRDEDRSPGAAREPTIAEVIELRLSRRAALKGIAAGVAAGFFGGALFARPARAAAGTPSSLTFTEIGRSLDDTTHVAPGYNTQVLMRWGDPISTFGPRFKPGSQTAVEQEQQFGMNNDFIAFMPLPRGSQASQRGLLCVNHEYTIPHLMWPGMAAQDHGLKLSREQVEVEMAAHGHTIIEVSKTRHTWYPVEDSYYNRRYTARTPIRIAGPAAGHARLRTNADPDGVKVIGTLGNCAGGVTPWGTVLIAEENFHYYFTGNAGAGAEAAARKRYGISGRSLYAWGRYFDRYNLDREPHEPNRYGWIVEIDPYDRKSVPVKRTALGRFKHECATTAVSHDGRVAVYSGDDERMEYVYKFVTRERFDSGNPAANRDLLDAGTLYAAKFETEGKMKWLPLVFGTGPLTPANGFNSQADVLIEARRAADLLGATPMDRPEDVETNPATGSVYVVMTHNDRRRPGDTNIANPRAPNRFGHVIEIVPPVVFGRPDHTATECDWGFFLMGGDPANPKDGARYDSSVTANGWLTTPDNIAFDPAGRIWIATDGQEEAAGFADSIYGADTTGLGRGATRCFFNAPRGAEVCGPAFTPDGRTLFLSIQHPGDEQGSTFDHPSTRWPDFAEGVPPRPAVVAITKGDGGVIGT